MRNLVGISELAKREDVPFTEPSLRWMVFNEGSNGLRDAGAIVRLGRRVYIDLDRFDAWLTSKESRHQQVAA